MKLSDNESEKQAEFELVQKYENDPDLMPQRSTRVSAGYDLKAAEEVMVLPYATSHKVYLISTGLKVKLPSDNYLQLANRSSNGLKRGLINPNGIGVIDADYYNNESNEGEIMFPVLNIFDKPYTVHVHDRICQGIILPYGLVAGDHYNNEYMSARTGGFGSSGR